MFNDIKVELLVGDISGAPLHMRPNLSGLKGGFMEMLLTGKATENEDAMYLYVALFERKGKEVVELNYPGYRRIPVIRNMNGWKPFKGKDSSFVMINAHNIIYPMMRNITLVNYAGITDWQGKLMSLGKLTNPFMGIGHIGFATGSLIIRLP